MYIHICIYIHTYTHTHIYTYTNKLNEYIAKKIVCKAKNIKIKQAKQHLIIILFCTFLLE